MTKLTILMLAVVTMVGCGAPFDPAQDCYFGNTTIHLQAQGDCEYYGAVLEDSIAAIRTNHFGNEDEIRHLREREIWVRDTYTFESDGSQVLGDEHEPTGNIELTVDASAMMHELLHSLNAIQGAANSDNEAHKYWDEKGAQLGARAIYVSGHREAFGSWYNVSDNSMMSWMNIYLYHMDWRTLSQPITQPTPDVGANDVVQAEVPAASPR
jgi:hypothetical protein